jgi:hypothetical protein
VADAPGHSVALGQLHELLSSRQSGVRHTLIRHTY